MVSDASFDTHFRNNVILDEAGGAIKVIWHPMIITITSEINVDHVINKFSEGWFHTGWR